MFFEELEVKAIKKAMYAFYGGPPPELDEHKVMGWPIDTRINVGLVDAVLHGYLAVGVRDGELVLRLTPEGKKKMDDLLKRARPDLLKRASGAG